MNDIIKPDDPRLTAYALGELEGEEATAVATAVASDPALAAVVEEVQAMAGSLEDAFGAEPLPVVTPIRVTETERERSRDLAKIVRFPYYWVSGLAAAAFAVLLVVKTSQTPIAHQEKVPAATYTYQLDLGEAPTEPVALPATNGNAVNEDVMLSPFQDPATIVSSRQAPTGAGDLQGKVLFVDGQAVTVITSEFLENFAATDNESLLQYTTGTEVGTIQGGYAGPGPRRPGELQRVASNEAENVTPQASANAVAPPPIPTGVRGFTSMDSAGSIRVAPDGSGIAALSLAAPQPLQTEGYAPIDETGFRRVPDHPLSTFAVEADTASYANVRRFIANGSLPPADAVRIEELVNAFPYDYAPPTAATDAPFAAHLEVAAAPWAPEHQLVRIGLKGRELAAGERGAANLVFLLDVSGSMNQANKLPLVKAALRLLIGKLQPNDRVAIVTYAGSSGLALPSTPVNRGGEILAALDALQAAGSTNGAMGIHLAYDVARANFVEGGINRVILCTDGDFNVGETGVGDLGRLVEEKAATGVFLTALGFGMGNYQDQMLERLAGQGNGFYGYIDTEKEARRLLVEQVDGTLAVIAKDVKIQVEFNPARVAAYRLIGYENRRLNDEDFNDDRVDAGEIGAGHTVTALYEIVPTGAEVPTIGAVDDLRYQRTVASASVPAALADELLTVKVRAKAPDSDESRRWEFPLVAGNRSFAAASDDFRFASAVAGFGMVLRESAFKGTATFTQVAAWAETAIGSDLGGHRREFLALVRQAGTLADRLSSAE